MRSLFRRRRTLSELVASSAPAVVMIECPDIRSKGTGFLISSDGHILTNNHVVSDIGFPQGVLRLRYSREIQVISNKGQSVALPLTDPSEPRPVVFDYAILKIESELATPFLELGTLADVQAGDRVLCLGYPLDFRRVVATQGIVSTLIRRPSHWNSLHQMNTVLTDALIQFGNSGGPLLHERTGRVIAMNTLGHEYTSPLVDELELWRNNPDAQAVPGLAAVIDYAMKYSYVGLNYAISLEYVRNDPQWPMRNPL